MHDEIRLHAASILGTGTPIRKIEMKGWLFQQGWLTQNPDTQMHPMRWTSISKGQVWNPPPQEPLGGSGSVLAGSDWFLDTR